MTKVVRTAKRGVALMRDPLLNKGAAFDLRERRELGLEGLLPSSPVDQDIQARRVYARIRTIEDPLDKYVALTELHDRNEHLYFRILQDHLDDLLPIVYTPTVGLATQRFSHVFQRGRGAWITPEHRGRIAEVLRCAANGRDIRLIVATDNESILGIGDQGAGGMAISIGKLALYTSGAGVDPSSTLPISIDVGTENGALLEDEMYLGWRHRRLRGEDYLSFFDELVSAVKVLFPGALIQWEDFRKDNALTVLDRYRSSLPSFNDDIQGTGAVALAAVMAAGRFSGRKLGDETILILGAGAAGLGIARQIRSALADEGLTPDEICRHVAVLDSRGLIIDDGSIRDEYKRELSWTTELARAVGFEEGQTDFSTVVRTITPTVLIGTSGQAGAFSRDIVEHIAARVEKPLILPISNPTSHSEATPQDVYEWTQGNCIVAAGSPFPPVHFADREIPVSQCNNAFIFPGVGLATMVGQVSRISDQMFRAAAGTLADCVTESDLAAGRIFPPVNELSAVSARVAEAVIEQARRDGSSAAEISDVRAAIASATWTPEYPQYQTE